MKTEPEKLEMEIEIVDVNVTVIYSENINVTFFRPFFRVTWERLVSKVYIMHEDASDNIEA